MIGGMSSPPITPEQLAALPPEFRAILQAVIDHYEARIVELEAKLAELESRLPKTPQNSSLPPSTQHPHAKPTAKKPKSTKKRGGQPGHLKHSRPLLPTDQCDEVVTLRPTACRRCGAKLRGRDSAPLRHQVYELPEIKPHVTEYQRQRLTCACGLTTCAELPVGVTPSQAGPHLTALVALLMGSFRQSKRRVALFLSTILQQPCSPSWVVKLQGEATAALRPAYDELQAQLPTEPIVGVDESPTKEANHKSWLWTAVAPKFTLFVIRPTREATALTELLGAKFKGVVNCDRAKMYFQLRRTQWCWAHLQRDFQGLIDRGTKVAKRLGYDLLRPTRELFRRWKQLRAGALTRLAWRRLMTPIREEIDALLLRGMFSGESPLVRMCRGLYHHRERLWTFLKVAGVEPTNNASERALRPAVIWRKLSFGTQSAAGSRFVETILSVVETCRQQQRGVFAYLTAAIQARREGKTTPSLLPGV
jgi:transposase